MHNCVGQVTSFFKICWLTLFDRSTSTITLWMIGFVSLIMLVTVQINIKDARFYRLPIFELDYNPLYINMQNIAGNYGLYL